MRLDAYAHLVVNMDDKHNHALEEMHGYRLLRNIVVRFAHYQRLLLGVRLDTHHPQL